MCIFGKNEGFRAWIHRSQSSSLHCRYSIWEKKSQVPLSFLFLCISDHVRSPRPQSVAALCADLLDVRSSNCCELNIAFDVQPKPLNHTNGHICQICGDDVGVTTEGELFVACNECAFPVCRPCFEYERKDGNQSCPQCKTRYKRLKGEPFQANLLLVFPERTTYKFLVEIIANLSAKFLEDSFTTSSLSVVN